MRILVAYNPTAGGDGRDDVRETLAALERAGHDVRAQSVKDDGWERALQSSCEFVVAAGGDGTVADVFKKLAGTSLPVAVVPIGNANNIARSIERLRRETRFDLSALEWSSGATMFVESCGGGVFTEMVARAAATQEHSSGNDKVELGLRSLLEVATAAEAAEWRVGADGLDLSGEYIAVEVLNIALLGPNVPLAPTADPGDGLLDLVLVRAAEAATLAAYARARLDGVHEAELRLETHRARKIVLEPPPDTQIRLDDELLGSVGRTLTATVETNVDVRPPPVSGLGEA